MYIGELVQDKFSSVDFCTTNLKKCWKLVKIENSPNFRKFPTLQNSRNFPWKVSKIPGNFPVLCIPTPIFSKETQKMKNQLECQSQNIKITLNTKFNYASPTCQEPCRPLQIKFACTCSPPNWTLNNQLEFQYHLHKNNSTWPLTALTYEGTPIASLSQVWYKIG